MSQTKTNEDAASIQSDGYSRLDDVRRGFNRVAIAAVNNNNHDDESASQSNAGSVGGGGVACGGRDESKGEIMSTTGGRTASVLGKHTMLESDSQSSVSGGSWGKSSFRTRGKLELRSPRWMDHQGNNGSLMDENAVVSFAMLNRRTSSNSSHENNRDYASPSFHAAHDSHDEGYLSHSTVDLHHSFGFHPTLSYAPSVKSDIATVCSGSVVDDVDMTEIGSVISDGGGKRHHRSETPQFASNILNDMGPPTALCSALLLAANAACRPSSTSLHSFDTNDDGKSAVSDVDAHVDTDDCCDRSIVASEVSTLHSQDDMTSEHKDGILDGSVMSADVGSSSSMRHYTYSRGHENLPLQRFRHGHLTEGVLLPPEGLECIDHEREDDWSNSRSLSRSPSRSLSPSSSSSSRSRSRSRSRSPPECNNHRGRSRSSERSNQRRIRPSWYRERQSCRHSRKNNDGEARGPPVEELMEDDDGGGYRTRNPNHQIHD